MAIKYIPEVVTDQDKIEFLYIAQEKIREEHNAKGKDFNDGVISKEQFEIYRETDWHPKQESISIEINKIKESFKKSTKFDFTTQEVFE